MILKYKNWIETKKIDESVEMTMPFEWTVMDDSDNKFPDERDVLAICINTYDEKFYTVLFYNTNDEEHHYWDSYDRNGQGIEDGTEVIAWSYLPEFPDFEDKEK